MSPELQLRLRELAQRYGINVPDRPGFAERARLRAQREEAERTAPPRRGGLDGGGLVPA